MPDADTPTPQPARPCPICGKPATPKSNPFCSSRCAEVDLHRWLSGTYRVETDETPDPDEPA
ncbi:MAG: DNA gyrase inhibitor YacG [Actinomycetota bacterium]